MSNPNTFQLCQMILVATATRAAEPIEYTSWGTEFAISNIRDLPGRLMKSPNFFPVDPNDLTREEMENLGFRKWSSESDLMLIPLYLLPYLKEGITVIDISDEQYYFFREEADNDHRMGLLAFGVVPKA
ncbi:hypothetical protein Lw1_gp176 [Escherichia phage Lw1]|uniref:Uncharacterized protein n=2 Tax=Pseudotevenvirus TaxID=2842979 RepID=M9V2R7_9CAUD|nr:hypothetical protein RB16p171 [Escherichia phage RB16]YP_008060698.1 hypothetical protein Lw1_gp176 [Escherichia phage Lw1]ADJ55475.1 conserved hypothetical phage protein [Escherichia phage RB16]AGJ71583.1 hypothetical protein Lw1_gp176 [Escherichia phage Lw1]